MYSDSRLPIIWLSLIARRYPLRRCDSTQQQPTPRPYRLLPLLLLLLLLLPISSYSQQPADATEGTNNGSSTADESAADRLPLPTPERREQIIADALQLWPNLAPDAVSLQADTTFIALYREEMVGRPQGGVLLLPDLESNPAGELIATLRQQLPEHGWHTLALQLPLGDEAVTYPAQLEALLDPALRRAEAGLNFLQAQGVFNNVVIGYGFGALVATQLAQQQPQKIQGLVVIGMPGYREPERLDAALQLAQVPQPILDIYGEQDLFSVLDSTHRRAAMARRARVIPGSKPPHPAAHPRNSPKQPPAYRQQLIGGADHSYLGFGDQLLRRVKGWLQRHTAGMKVTG